MKKNERNHLKFFGIGRILPYLRDVRKLLLIMVFLGLLSSVIDIIIPLYQRYALDHFVGLGIFDTIIPFVIAYVATLLLAAFANYVSCAIATIVEVRVNRDLRKRGFEHLQTLSFSYFNQNSVGYIHARLMSDTSRIGGLVSWTLIDCVWRVTYLVGAIVVMVVLNPKLAVMVLATLPLLVILFSIFQKKLIHVNREVREVNSKITGNFNEGITGAKTIKSLAIEEKMEQHFTEETQKMRKKTVQASRLRGMFVGTMNFASSVALAIVLWKGGYIAAEEMGTFSVFMSYAQGMMEPLRWLVDIISDLITTQVNIERFTNLLAVKSDVTDTPEVIEKYGDSLTPKKENWEELKGDITFEDVTFHYPDGEEIVLENFCGLTAEDAERKLKEYGLLAKFSGVGETVTSQLPMSGQIVPGGSEILLYLGEETEEESVTVPSFLGMTRQQAAEAAERLGLYLLVTGNQEIAPAVTVTNQSIAEETQVPVGTTVTLEFTDTTARD